MKMNRLPVKYKKYFWDCDFEKLNIVKHKEYILNRLLSFGDLSAIRFVFKNFAQNDVTNYLDFKGSKSLTRTNYLFWKKLIKYDELWRN